MLGTWLLYELAHHADDQNRLRDEIDTTRAKLGRRDDFVYNDLENMPFVNACIKVGDAGCSKTELRSATSQEVFRFHPISSWVTRESAIEDVNPLAEPIVTAEGKSISQIEIGKHLPVLVSITGMILLVLVTALRRSWNFSLQGRGCGQVEPEPALGSCSEGRTNPCRFASQRVSLCA
jgi:hypothetical protein